MSKRQAGVAFAFLVAGLMLALCSAAHKVMADRDYRDVVVLVDWHSLNSLPEPSEQSEPGSSAWQLMQAIPGAMLCYGEETVGTLLDQGIIRPAENAPGSPAFKVIGSQYVDDIARGANRHGYRYWPDGSGTESLVFQVPDLPEEDLALLPVAWLSSVMHKAREQSVEYVLRPGGSEFLGEDGISRTLEYCSAQQMMLFQGPTVLGYPGSLDEVAQQIGEQGQFFGWVEFDEQDGGAGLAAKLTPNVIRIHSIPPEEMVNYSSRTAVDRYIRAVKERNIRCIYVRPFIRGSVLTSDTASGYRHKLDSYNRQYFTALNAAMEESGFSIEKTPKAPADPLAWLQLVRPLATTLAVGAVAIMLLSMWLTAWPRWVWSLFLALAALKGIAAMFLPVVDSAVLLAAALAFPLWGAWLALLVYNRLSDRLSCNAFCPRRLFIGMLALVIASAATIAGGLLIHAGMWDSAAMLKITQFRGVTLSMAVPVLLFAAYTWHGETLQDAFDKATLKLQDYWQRFMQLWMAPIRYGDIAFILIALGAIGIVLLRSGNESPLEILSIESWFRGSLEDWFAIRPRTKELLGHPAFVLFLMSIPWRNRITLLFGVAGLLGQISILNTFCHLHTPLEVTLARVALGLGLGLATGMVWGLVALVIARIILIFKPASE